MLRKRIVQSRYVEQAETIFKNAYGYIDENGNFKEDAYNHLDPDILSDNIMSIVNDLITRDETMKNQQNNMFNEKEDGYEDEYADDINDYSIPSKPSTIPNDSVSQKSVQSQKNLEVQNERTYLGKFSKNDILGGVLDRFIINMYTDKPNLFVSSEGFSRDENFSLYYNDVKFIESTYYSSEYMQNLSKNKNAYGFENAQGHREYKVTDAFKKYLVELSDWNSFLNGDFLNYIKNAIR